MLYIVPTPIGNLGDITPRIASCLEEVDFIAAEDTRVTLKLLNHLGIKKQMLPYHRHNTQAGGEAIVERLLRGDSCALVSDAGTPAISDPGEELVALCISKKIPVVPLAGPCALITALCASGIATGRFCFEGFLAMNKKNRKNHLLQLKEEYRTMIFYEAPHKLNSTLVDLRDTFGGDREIAICRELTKLHEEILHMTLDEGISHFQENTPRGEFVLVLAGGPILEVETPTLEDGVEQVHALVSQGISMRDACKEVAGSLSLSRNSLYRLAVEQSAEN
ncbi:MAG: 16S rRNA (cytidine(1402)-2'-O)-methyltransferase [Eubacteriales bacterium]